MVSDASRTRVGCFASALALTILVYCGGQALAQGTSAPSGASGETPAKTLSQTLAETTSSVAQSASTPTGKFLESLLKKGGGRHYRQFLSAYKKLLEKLNAEMPSQELTDKLAWVKQIKVFSDTVKWTSNVLSIGGNLYAGKWDEAAWKSASLAFTEFIGTESGKAMLAYMGIPGPGWVLGLVTAVEVARDSYKELAKEEEATLLESLYGAVENTCRARGRALGQGDPFPPTAENVEKLWKKLLTNPSFRNSFRVYVTTMLNQEFPEPGFFSTVEAYLVDPIFGNNTTTASGRVEQKARDALQAEEKRMKQYLLGLISVLNRRAKADEARLVALKKVKELEAAIKSAGFESIDQYLDKLQKAALKLGVAEAAAKDCGERVTKAIASEDYETLRAIIETIEDYFQDCLVWLPDDGPIGKRKAAVAEALLACYNKATAGIGDIRKKLQAKLDKPVAPDQQLESDPLAIYERYFKPKLKPFDWGGSGSPDVAKDKLLGYLKTGHFATPAEGLSLPKGRKPLAQLLIQAWSKQNFPVAFSGVDGMNSIPDPDPKNTIRGYDEKLREQFRGMSCPSGVDPSAWGKAVVLADNARKAIVESAMAEFNETANWMQDVLQQYQALAKEAQERKAEIQTKLKAAANGLPAKDESQDSAMLALAKAESLLADEPYTGLEKMPKPERDFVAAVRQWADSKAYQNTTRAEQLKNNIDALLYSGGIVRWQKDNSIGSYEVWSGAWEILESYEQASKDWDAVVRDAAADEETIRTYVDPNFMRDKEFQDMAYRREVINERVAKARSKLQALDADATRRVDEMIADAIWVGRMATNLERWVQSGLEDGSIVSDSDRSDQIVGPQYYDMPQAPPAALRTQPYQHYMLKNEIATITAKRQSEWQALKLDGFATGVAPWLNEIYQAYIKYLNGLRSFPEDNFILSDEEYVDQSGKVSYNSMSGYYFSPITGSLIEKAEKILARMNPMDGSFMDAFRELWQTIYLGISWPAGKDLVFKRINPVLEKAPLWPRYKALRDKVIEAYNTYKANEGKIEQLERQKRIEELKKSLGPWLEKVRARVADAMALVAKSDSIDKKQKAEIKKAIEDVISARQHLTDEPYADLVRGMELLGYAKSAGDSIDDSLLTQAKEVVSSVGNASSSLAQAESRLRAKLADTGSENEAVKKLYDDFKDAYESKNDSRVMSLIGDNWSANDGTTLADLQSHLRNSFTVFDEIRYSISGLRIEQVGEGKFKVSYDVKITGRNFSADIKHEEKSSVTEEVTVNSAGKAKITRTLEGRFWYVE